MGLSTVVLDGGTAATKPVVGQTGAAWPATPAWADPKWVVGVADRCDGKRWGLPHEVAEGLR